MGRGDLEFVLTQQDLFELLRLAEQTSGDLIL